jgi:hypothetical protein
LVSFCCSFFDQLRGKYNSARRLDFDIALFCQISCRMVELRQWYLDDMRRSYESGIDAEGEGQNDDVETMETAKTLHSNRVHDCAMYLRLVELIEWGRTNELQIDDLYTHRVECYHDDEYWKECCHGEYK